MEHIMLLILLRMQLHIFVKEKPEVLSPPPQQLPSSTDQTQSHPLVIQVMSYTCE